MNENPYYNYSIDSISFLERARDQLQLFDEQEMVSSLLYAALELRLGIEAKLYETIDALNKSEGKSKLSTKEYAASKLLRKMLAIDPLAGEETTFTMILHPMGTSQAFSFTPATTKLVSMHGRLGEMLHYLIFRNTEYWYIKKPNEDESNISLAKYRAFIDEVIDELLKCSSGDLILPVKFKKAK